MTMISQLKDGVKFTLDDRGAIYIRKTYRTTKKTPRITRMYYVKEGIEDLHYYLNKVVNNVFVS